MDADIDKAIEEMSSTATSASSTSAKVMYESRSELDDMNIAYVRKAGRHPHKTHESDGAQVVVVDIPGALQETLSHWLKGGGGGHPGQNHVVGHQAADAHAQGGVQERSREDCLRDERVEPLQGVP